MYNGKHTGKYSSRKTGSKTRGSGRMLAMLLAMVLVLSLSVGGTIAFLAAESDSVTNQFIAGRGEIEIDEDVDNNIKEKVVIKNKGNIPVYVRVALVSNWNDADGNICINHSNDQPKFTLGENWVIGDDGYYYYKLPVLAKNETSDLLGSGIALSEAEDECTEGKCTYQVMVMASAIQSQPENAFKEAWGSSSGLEVKNPGTSDEQLG